MTFRYAFTLRPPFISTHPDGAQNIHAYNPVTTVVAKDGRKYWCHGTAEYDRPLTAEETRHFDLVLVDDD